MTDKLILYKSVESDVTAIITASDARDFRIVCKGRGDPIDAGVRIFLFVPDEVVKECPPHARVYNPLSVLVTALNVIAGEGNYEIRENKPEESGWNGKVPLSEGHLKYSGDTAPLWRKYCTTPEDFFEKFSQAK